MSVVTMKRSLPLIYLTLNVEFSAAHTRVTPNTLLQQSNAPTIIY
jgi:hypothetical protein